MLRGNSEAAAGALRERMALTYVHCVVPPCSDDAFDTNDAIVACRQLGLGFSGGWPLYMGNSTYPIQPGTDRIWLDDLECNPAVHTTFAECNGPPWGVNDCTHNEDVGVYCTGPAPPSPPPSPRRPPAPRNSCEFARGMP